MSGFLNDHVLGVFAECLDDLEKVRVANENRLRQLTDTSEHGHGLSADHPGIKRLSNMVEALCDAEDEAVKALQSAMKNHPLGPWVKAQKGVGEKQAARLLSVIGDPYWKTVYNEVDGEVVLAYDGPRTVSQLWAYCGMHVVNYQAPKRQRGQKANWSEDARKRVYLISASCIKTTGNYRAIYDQARLKYEDAKHNEECIRCGPKGKPAQPGSPLSAGHQHARALRIVSKTILKDLWIEAKRIHEEQE